MANTKQYKIKDDFKIVWRQWADPVETLEELQEALDLSDEYITLWVVKSISKDGIVEYTEQDFESLPLGTKIKLYGVQFEVPNDEFSPATAMFKILD